MKVHNNNFFTCGGGTTVCISVTSNSFSIRIIMGQNEQKTHHFF